MNNKKNYLKVIATATLSLAILTSTIQPHTAEATTQHFDYSKEEKDEKEALKNARAIQKETKNFTPKQRVAYYNKVLNKIVKDSKKADTKLVQILAIFHGVQSKLTSGHNYDATPKNYAKYYHKDPGVQAINAGYAPSKGYAYAMRDALRKAGFKSDVVSAKEYSETVYWTVVKLNGKYYHLDSYRSDKTNIEKNHDYFMVNGKYVQDFHYTYKLKKPYTATDGRYYMDLLDATRIVKETKTDYYSIIGIYGIAKTSKNGGNKAIYELPQGFHFAAEKNGWVYGFSNWNNKYFFKAHIDELIGTSREGGPLIKVEETSATKHDEHILTDKTITYWNKAGKKVTYTLGK